MLSVPRNGDDILSLHGNGGDMLTLPGNGDDMMSPTSNEYDELSLINNGDDMFSLPGNADELLSLPCNGDDLLNLPGNGDMWSLHANIEDIFSLPGGVLSLSGKGASLHLSAQCIAIFLKSEQSKCLQVLDPELDPELVIPVKNKIVCAVINWQTGFFVAFSVYNLHSIKVWCLANQCVAQVLESLVNYLKVKKKNHAYHCICFGLST